MSSVVPGFFFIPFESLISRGDAMPSLEACNEPRAAADRLVSGTSDILSPISGRNRHVQSMSSATIAVPMPADVARLGIGGSVTARTLIPITQALVAVAVSPAVASSFHSEYTPSAMVFAAA